MFNESELQSIREKRDPVVGVSEDIVSYIVDLLIAFPANARALNLRAYEVDSGKIKRTKIFQGSFCFAATPSNFMGVHKAAFTV